MSPGPALLLNVARPWGETDPVDAARHALACGLDGVGLADSPRLFPDAFIETERVLNATAVTLTGPCVASLGLRHPATVVSAVQTLERHHPGRVLTVVGRGESSVRNEGLGVPPLAAYRASLQQVRELLEHPEGPVAPGRVLGAASGPQTILATAAALGAVLIDAGARPEVIAKAVALARREEPGCTVWLFLRAVVTSSEQEAARAVEPVLGSCAARLAAAPDWYDLDPAAVADVRAVAQMHDYRRHGTSLARAGDTSVADRLVRERFVVAGRSEEIVRQLRPLAGLNIAGVVLAGALQGVGERLAELAGALREGLAPDGAGSPVGTGGQR